MDLTLQAEHVVVYDKVLAPSDFSALWEFVKREKYRDLAGGDWTRAWRLNDGTPLVSASYLHSQGGFDTPIDRVAESMAVAAMAHSDIVGRRPEEWDEIGLQVFLYRRGTRISWHRDTRYSDGRVAGSAVFYAHPHWSTLWAGELLVANESGAGGSGAYDGELLDGRDERTLLAPGFGTYIVPRPNRLVLISGRVSHATARVDPDAGEHVRCSFSGFFGRKGAYTDRR
jgi:hypothetical protein